MSIRAAALVILYHYRDEQIRNIELYSNYIEKVYVYDNSEYTDSEKLHRINSIKGVVLLSNGRNDGLPVAINIAAHKALESGFDWMFTFDQDSMASGEMIQTMIDFVDTTTKKSELAIVAPLISNGKLEFLSPVSEFSYYDRVIQSGALHNLQVWKNIGGYDEKLFIDQVDFEYCMHVLQRGYKIIRLNTAVLLHNIEDTASEIKYIHGKKITTGKFNPLRRYYIVRNTLYCGKKYRTFFMPYYATTKREREICIQGIRYESKKRIHYKAVMLGYIDMALGRMGKCRWKL